MRNKHKTAIQPEEQLSTDVIAFCALLARIMMRCLKERNPQVLEFLSLSSQAEEGKTGGTHDAT
jgi:hypothetical protein